MPSAVRNEAWNTAEGIPWEIFTMEKDVHDHGPVRGLLWVEMEISAIMAPEESRLGRNGNNRNHGPVRGLVWIANNSKSKCAPDVMPSG